MLLIRLTFCDACLFLKKERTKISALPTGHRTASNSKKEANAIQPETINVHGQNKYETTSEFLNFRGTRKKVPGHR